MVDTRHRASTDGAQPRRLRDRDATERALLAAARDLIMREGILSGLNLSDVSDEASVNRGLIYQYFGSRRELLRAAIAERHRAVREAIRRAQHFELDFADRRMNALDVLLEFADTFKLEALAIIDGDDEVRLFPFLDASLDATRRDVERGTLAVDDDPVMLHAVTSIAIQAYCIFREKAAAELGLGLEEMDRRARSVFRRIHEGLTRTNDQAGGDPGEAAAVIRSRLRRAVGRVRRG